MIISEVNELWFNFYSSTNGQYQTIRMPMTTREKLFNDFWFAAASAGYIATIKAGEVYNDMLGLDK